MGSTTTVQDKTKRFEELEMEKTKSRELHAKVQQLEAELHRMTKKVWPARPEKHVIDLICPQLYIISLV
jgi:hypothetical protein